MKTTVDQQSGESILLRLRELMNKPGGRQALRFLLNSAGSIPLIGGGIAGVSAILSEREQAEINEAFVDWADVATTEAADLRYRLEQIWKEPTEASLALLLGEIFGDETGSRLIEISPSEIGVFLNPATVAELAPYVGKGWIQLVPTGSVSTMGAHNTIGDYVEELRNPYGMGNSFILKLNINTDPAQ